MPASRVKVKGGPRRRVDAPDVWLGEERRSDRERRFKVDRRLAMNAWQYTVPDNQRSIDRRSRNDRRNNPPPPFMS